MTDTEVAVVPDAAAAAERVAAVVTAALAEGSGGGPVSLALSGGSGPVDAHRRMAAAPLAWDRVDVLQVDERFVPRHDDRSNWRMIEASLLEPAGVPDARRHPVPVDGTPAEAARRYESVLVDVLGPDGATDVCLMGIGPDGHTASLFPGSGQLEAEGLVTWGGPGMEPMVDRVTLTFDAINRSRLCVFLVTGAEKAEAVAAALAPTGDVTVTPARGVRPSGGRLVWVLDEAAAAKIAS